MARYRQRPHDQNGAWGEAAPPLCLPVASVPVPIEPAEKNHHADVRQDVHFGMDERVTAIALFHRRLVVGRCTANPGSDEHIP